MKRELSQYVGSSEEHKMQKQRDTLKLISPRTTITVTLVWVKEVMQKNQPSNLISPMTTMSMMLVRVRITTSP
jgi:hypothetical protein